MREEHSRRVVTAARLCVADSLLQLAELGNVLLADYQWRRAQGLE